MKHILRLSVVFVSLGLAAVGLQAQTNVYWNFGSGTGTPTQLSSNVTGGVITAFNFDSGYTPAFSPTAPASTGYTGLHGAASGVHNASVEVQSFAGPINTLTDAADPSATYFEFTLAPSSGYALQTSYFELGSRSKPGGGGAGPSTLTLVASTDNFTSNFTQLGTTSVTPDGNWALASISFATTTWATDTPVTFRIYGTDGSGGIGTRNWQIDDVTLAIIAVPEPSTYATLALGLGCLGLRFVRRRPRAAA